MNPAEIVYLQRLGKGFRLTGFLLRGSCVGFKKGSMVSVSNQDTNMSIIKTDLKDSIIFPLCEY